MTATKRHVRHVPKCKNSCVCVCVWRLHLVHKRNNIKTAEKKREKNNKWKKHQERRTTLENTSKYHRKKKHEMQRMIENEASEPLTKDKQKKHGKKHLPSRKLTWQWRIHHLKMYFLLKMVIFQCHVSFRGCKNTGRFGTTTSTLFKTRSFRHQR